MNRNGLTGTEIHHHYRLVAPDKGWVSTPTYLHRRLAIFDTLEGRPLDTAYGKVAFIGCGDTYASGL